MSEEKEGLLPVEPHNAPFQTEEKEKKAKRLSKPHMFPPAVLVGPLQAKPDEGSTNKSS